MSQNNDLYTPKKKVMPEVPGVRFEQRNYYDIDLLDGSFADKLYISVVEQIDDAIVAECVKIAHEAGIGQHIALNKKFIADAILEKLEAQQAINNVQPVDADVVRHGGWIHPKDHVVANEFFCSECNKRTASLRPINRQPHGALLADENGNFFYPPTMKYCSECGARMDGGADGD